MAKNIEYKLNNNIVFSCKYHIVKQYVENQQTSERPKEKMKWKEFLKNVNQNI